MKSLDTLTTYEREDRATRFTVKLRRNGRELGTYKREASAQAKADSTSELTYIVKWMQY